MQGWKSRQNYNAHERFQPSFRLAPHQIVWKTQNEYIETNIRYDASKI